MSATNRSDVRHPDDFYETPAWCVDALVDHLDDAPSVLDLGCGTGSIMLALQKYVAEGFALEGVEFNTKRARVARSQGLTVQTANVLELFGTYHSHVGGLVVMNPPYKLALEFVQKALTIVGTKGQVAALLRLNWLGSQSRAAFHKEHPSDVYILPKRPSFTSDGKTDACEYAWFTWGPGRGGRWSIL